MPRPPLDVTIGDTTVNPWQIAVFRLDVFRKTLVLTDSQGVETTLVCTLDEVVGLLRAVRYVRALEESGHG